MLPNASKCSPTLNSDLFYYLFNVSVNETELMETNDGIKRAIKRPLGTLDEMKSDIMK